MTRAEYHTAVWNALLRGSRHHADAYRIIRAADCVLAAFPGSEIESYEGPEPEPDVPLPSKQRDLFDNDDELSYLWDEFQRRMNDPDA